MQINVFDMDYFKYYHNVDDLIKYIKENYITSFTIMENETQDEINAKIIKDLSERTKERNAKLKYFDYNHQCFSYEDNVFFTNKFYNNNKKIINRAIRKNLLKSKYVVVQKELYTDELAKRLSRVAKNIAFYDVDLPSEIIKLYNKKRLNVYVRKNGVTTQVSSSRILGLEYTEVVSCHEEVELKPDINDYENLKYIPKHRLIIIGDVNANNYDNVLKIIETLNKNNQKNMILLKIENRLDFVKHDLFKNNNYNYTVLIEETAEDYTHQELKEEEKLFDIIVSDINSKNYSPYEKFLACYNITKKFKKYKDNEKNSKHSRTLKLILNNEYMVCVGYAELLEELLARVGIKSYYYITSADISYNDGFTLEEKPVDMIGHAKLIVSIYDPKYNINGFYINDNDLENDYYNHALISFDKETQGFPYTELTDEDLLINVKGMGDFKERVNYYINKEIREARDIDQELIELKLRSNNELLITAYGIVIKKILDILKKLLPSEYNNLSHKYKDLIKINLASIKYLDIDCNEVFKEYDELLTDAGYIFINNLGKDVPLEVTIDAASNVNKEVFGLDDDKIKIYKEKLLEENIKRDKDAFPYYYQKNNGRVM